MTIEGDSVTFSSGHTISANCGIIGLTPELDLTEGSDAGLYTFGWEMGSPLTAEDLTELADYMIEQWHKFKQLVADNRDVIAEENRIYAESPIGCDPD